MYTKYYKKGIQNAPTQQQPRSLHSESADPHGADHDMEPIQVTGRLVSFAERVLPKNGQTKDKAHSRLSSVETGTMPALQWRTEKSSILDDTPFDVTATTSAFTRRNKHCQLETSLSSSFSLKHCLIDV